MTLDAAETGALGLAVSSIDPRDPVTVTVSGLPADAALSDTAGPIAVRDGTVTLTPAQLLGLSLTAGVTPATLTITATSGLGGGASTSRTVALGIIPADPSSTLPGPPTFPGNGTTTPGATPEPPAPSIPADPNPPASGTTAPAAPTLTVPGTLTLVEDGTGALPLAVAPADPRDPVTVTISGLPADAALTGSAGPIAVANGSVTLTPAQLAGLSLTAGITSATLTVSATSGLGTGASTSRTVVLGITPVAPTLTAPGALTLAEDGAGALALAVTPADPRDPVTITISGLPADAALTGSAGPIAVTNGSATLTPAQLAGLSLTSGVTPATLTITATNGLGAGASTTRTVALTVDSAAPPPAPRFALSAADQADTNATRSASVTLVGQTGAGDTVTLSNGAKTVAGSTGIFQFTNVSLAAGDNALTAQSTDAHGRRSSFTLTIERLPAATGPDAAVLWNQATLGAIATAASDPEIASRALAIESLAVYDAVSGIDGTPGYLVSLAAPAGASAEAAVAAAAREVLLSLYPNQKASFDALYASSSAALPDGQAKADGIAFGTAVADKVLALRAGDGWNDLVDDEGSTAVGQWRPTAPNFTPAEEPQWATLTPFALDSQSQFRAPAPPDLTSQAYADAVNETLSLGASNSTTRTADETQIAKFWTDGSGTYTPAGHWNAIADTVAQQKGDSLAQDARLLAELNVAEADSAIAAWDTKYTYDTWRPITVAARADSIGNSGITAIPGWTPLINTPSHPEYVSGHSTFSEAAAQVLDDAFGADTSFTIGSPGVAGVTRRYTSFDQAAQEAGESRIYGGIHFEFSNTAGQAIGKSVGQWTLKAFDDTADTVAPKLALHQASGFATNAAVILTGSATDNLSGVARIQYRLDGGPATDVAFKADGSFSLPLGLATDGTADGAHTVQLIAADAAGNVAAPVSVSFDLETRAPVFTLGSASVQDGGTLAAGALVAGTAAAEDGIALEALSYTLDGGKAVPLGFDAKGAFSQALDLSKLGTGAHTLVLSATDAAGNTAADTLHLTLPNLPPLTVTALTPMMGAGDVGVTYRPQITFSRAVDPSTLTADSFYATDTTGAKVPATIVPLADGTGAYLFFKGALPGASTITLHVDGSKIKAAADGALLDAAGTGVPGSAATDSFTTVSTAPVPGTNITGRVLDPGADLTPMTADDFKAGPNGPSDFAHDTFKLPVAGVKVYVLGHEDQAVYTAADGSFTLASVPTGDVKVVFDGRTATNAPSGLYFPEMTMDTTIRPGIANTIMGSMGTADSQAYNAANPAVYLPRVQSSILQSVSATDTTVVGVPQEAASGLTAAQASKLTLTVAPGSIVDANGNPVADAKVGISPVAPQIVMDMLPPGVMQHTFDITIQVPDGAAFTTPATLTLPNVFNAAPGTKLNILSFDHTTGRLVIDGTGTVSADGTSVTTDPGSGVTKPGWHGMTPPGTTVTPTIASPPNGPNPCWNAGIKTAGSAADLVKDTVAVVTPAAAALEGVIAGAEAGAFLGPGGAVAGAILMGSIAFLVAKGETSGSEALIDAAKSTTQTVAIDKIAGDSNAEIAKDVAKNLAIDGAKFALDKYSPITGYMGDWADLIHNYG